MDRPGKTIAQIEIEGYILLLLKENALTLIGSR